MTLNHLAQDAQPIEAHLAQAMAEVGMPYPGQVLARRLARGECLLLLDALDEVVDGATYQRAIAEVNRLRAAYGDRNQIIVTSRIAGFQHALNGYLQVEVQEFTPEQIDLFVHSWFADTADPAQRQARIDGLLQALGRSPRMRLLASNPLLASLMALLYEHDWRLPERRVELYEACVHYLIEEWDRLRGVRGTPRFASAHTHGVLTRLAAQFHTAGVRVFTQAQLLATLAEVLPDCGEADVDPQAFLQEVMERTGLLRQKSRTSYDFVHLTFQEFFTACACRDAGEREALLGHSGEAWWQEVIRLYAGLEADATVLLERLRSQDVCLAAGCLADCLPVETAAFRDAAEAIVSELQHLVCTGVAQRQDAADALAEIAGWGATAFLTEAVAQDTADPALALAALLALARAVDQAVLDPLFADLGRALRLLNGQLPLADPPRRERILSVLDMLGHPLVFVPAGAFRMGSDSGMADERPPHTVTLQEYWIDTFPVTNAQFARFIEETNSQARGPWQSAFTPEKARHPVVNVTWDDACAYGQWCGKRLPTEAEWEKSARGTDGREYPWGNQWDGNKCNASGRGTTTVGAYPAGASPYGVHDMAGNVYEWCHDWYDAGYYASSPDSDPQGPSSRVDRVFRGGGWNGHTSYCRSAYRSPYVPGFRRAYLGFRLLRSVL